MIALSIMTLGKWILLISVCGNRPNIWDYFLSRNIFPHSLYAMVMSPPTSVFIHWCGINQLEDILCTKVFMMMPFLLWKSMNKSIKYMGHVMTTQKVETTVSCFNLSKQILWFWQSFWNSTRTNNMPRFETW